jgi:hypothetical protein
MSATRYRSRRPDFAAAQRAVEREQRWARCVVDAVIEIEGAVEVVGGDRRVGGFEFDLRRLQVAGDAQRGFGRRGDIDASVQRAALQACAGPAFRKQALRPCDRDAGEVDARQVGRRGAALDGHRAAALLQRAGQASFVERDAESEDFLARAQFAFAAPAVGIDAAQRQVHVSCVRRSRGWAIEGAWSAAAVGLRVRSRASPSCTWTPSSVAIGKVIFAMSHRACVRARGP